MFFRLRNFGNIWHVHCRRDVRSPPPPLLSLRLSCCCRAGVGLLCCVVVLMVVLLPLSRLCDDEALPRTQQARYAVCSRCGCDSLLLVMGDVYRRQVSYQVQRRQW